MTKQFLMNFKTHIKSFGVLQDAKLNILSTTLKQKKRLLKILLGLGLESFESLSRHFEKNDKLMSFPLKRKLPAHRRTWSTRLPRMEGVDTRPSKSAEKKSAGRCRQISADFRRVTFCVFPKKMA